MGTGGREHAIGWYIKKLYPSVSLFFLPGNLGTSQLGTNFYVKESDYLNELADIVHKNNIDLIIPASEDPLVKGIYDLLSKHTLLLGPDKKAALLEGSKIYAIEFAKQHNIPIPLSQYFDDFNKCVAYLTRKRPPYVIKADGLAMGKGTFIINELNKAIDLVYDLMVNKKLGEAGRRLVIQEYKVGIEASLFFLVSGRTYKLLGAVQDFKRLGESIYSPNTGGMASIAPHPELSPEIIEKAIERILVPTITHVDYHGILYLGIIVDENEVYLLEYNVRLGDPEAEVLLPILDYDILPDLVKIAKKEELEPPANVPLINKYAVDIVIAGKNYPYSKEDPFSVKPLIDYLISYKDILVFYGNVRDNYITDGGRILHLVSLAPSVLEAKNKLKTVLSNLPLVEKLYYRQALVG